MTAQQLAAVETTALAALVVAPAGSGKSQVMAERIGHLLQSGVEPENILALTFTRNAARNIRDRIERVVGDAGEHRIADMTIGTVHSVALRILQTYGDRIGYAPTKLTVIDPDEADMLLRIAAESLGHLHRGKWRSSLSLAMTQSLVEAHDAGASEREIVDVGGNAGRDIVREFNTSMFRNNAVTFGRILTECRRLLTTCPDVLGRYQRRWNYIIVDEIQDSAQIEFSLYELLAPPSELFMVGDLRQSIYSFRYARPDYLEQLVGAKRVQVYDLEQSFRCGSAICDAANRLIAHNPGFTGKPMIPASGRKGNVEVFAGKSEGIVAKVKALIVDGRYRPGEIAVLARTNRVFKRLSGLMIEAGVRFNRIGRSFDVTDSPAFKTIRAMLRLVVNQNDDLAFMALAGPLGVADLSAFTARAKAERLSLWNYYSDFIGQSLASPVAAWIESTIAATTITVRADGPAEEADPDPTMGVFASTALAEADAMPDDERKAWRFWLNHCDDMTVAEALDWYACHNSRVDQQEDANGGNAVTLATIHASKGLEWPCVVVCDLNDGNFPSARSLREVGGDIEERRVGYVAMTRASELLLLHYRRPEHQSNKGPIKPPSRFLIESGVLEGEAVPA